MALTLHVVLTTAELDDADLVVTAVGNHFSGNLRTFDDRQADFHVFAIGNQQDAVEIDRFAGSDVEFLDLEEFAFGDFVLLATGNNHCVHVYLR